MRWERTRRPDDPRAKKANSDLPDTQHLARKETRINADGLSYDSVRIIKAPVNLERRECQFEFSSIKQSGKRETDWVTRVLEIIKSKIDLRARRKRFGFSQYFSIRKRRSLIDELKLRVSGDNQSENLCNLCEKRT